MADSPVELALTRWRNNLIDLSRRNPLLALKPTRSSYLEIKQPDVATLFNAFVLQEKTWTYFLPPPPPGKGDGGEGNTLPPSAPGRGVGGEGNTLPPSPPGRGVGGEGNINPEKPDSNNALPRPN